MEETKFIEISNSIIGTLNTYGALEFGSLCIKVRSEIGYTSTPVKSVLADLVDGGIIAREKCGTKPYINSVMLRNVYKYIVIPQKP